MKKQVVFIDSQLNANRTFAEALSADGYDVLAAEGLDQLIQHAQLETCVAIVFAAYSDESKVSQITSFRSQFPNFPIVYVAPHDVSIEVNSDALHHHIRPLTQKQKFLKVVADLSHLRSLLMPQAGAAENKALFDEHTGLYNNRYLTLFLDNEIRRASRNLGKFSVAFIDIDNFKKVNQKVGYENGNHVLCEIGKIIKDCIRTTDHGFHQAGDQFVAILVDANVDSAQIVAERIRERLEKSAIKVGKHRISVTASLGLVGYPEHGLDAEQIIEVAKESMYSGKRKNRNKVNLAS